MVGEAGSPNALPSMAALPSSVDDRLEGRGGAWFSFALGGSILLPAKELVAGGRVAVVACSAGPSDRFLFEYAPVFWLSRKNRCSVFFFFRSAFSR
jgi:hypothetical protein